MNNKYTNSFLHRLSCKYNKSKTFDKILTKMSKCMKNESISLCLKLKLNSGKTNSIVLSKIFFKKLIIIK